MKGSGAQQLMNYNVVKVLNNNSVLCQDKSGEQIILMSKGIGFGKKTGDALQPGGENQKIFYILDSRPNLKKLDAFRCDEESMQHLTQQIVDEAEKRLHIKNSNLYSVLLDHITFAIECLQMGLPIENPFISEISVLYREEFEVAQLAAGIIKERTGVEIGEEEAGFIALHLYSARQNKHIRTTMKNTRVYNEILNVVSESTQNRLDLTAQEVSSFLLCMEQFIQLELQKQPIHMPFMQEIRQQLTFCWQIAEKIASLVKRELEVSLSEDSKAFLAVELHKIFQMQSISEHPKL